MVAPLAHCPFVLVEGLLVLGRLGMRSAVTLAVLFVGCGRGDNTPGVPQTADNPPRVPQPIAEANGALRTVLPAGWNLGRAVVAEFVAGPQTGTVLSTFSAEVSPIETLVDVLGTVEGTNVVKEVLHTSETVTMFGKLAGTARGALWLVEARIEGPDTLVGRGHGLVPISSTRPYVLTDSSEHKALLAAASDRKAAEVKAESDARLKVEQAQSEARIREIEQQQAARHREEETRAKAERDETAARESARRDQESAKQQQKLAALQGVLAPLRAKNGLLAGDARTDRKWSQLVVVDAIDEGNLSFRGRSWSFERMPYSEVPVTGTAADRDGRPALFVRFGGEERRYEKADDTTYRGEDRQFIDALSEAERRSLDLLLVGQTVASKESDLASGAITQVLDRGAGRHAERGQIATAWQQLQLLPVSWDVSISSRGNETYSKSAIDGDLTSFVYVTKSIRLRVRTPVQSSGIVIDCGGGGQIGLIVNGVSVGTLSPDNHELSLFTLRFSKSVMVMEVELRVLVAYNQVVNEIGIVR